MLIFMKFNLWDKLRKRVRVVIKPVGYINFDMLVCKNLLCS